MSDDRSVALIGDLLSTVEKDWVEFKENNYNPPLIGKLISALSNAARVSDQPFAYVLWGIRDGDRQVVGTSFSPGSETHQREPLEFWLAKRLNPAIEFQFLEVSYSGKRILMLEIPAASPSPVEFDGTAFIRIGSATPKLSEHPQRLQALWDRLRSYSWEMGTAVQYTPTDKVLELLDHQSYFELTRQTPSTRPESILERLCQDRLVSPDVGGRWSITNLGAILFARRLSAFDTRIARKAVRFVAYDGNSRADQVTHRQEGQLGYANGFKKLVDYIDALLPRNEHIDKAFRTETPLYPEIAIRELVANALIHQDMTVTGAGPMIELFKNRLEITNPGVPLINPERFIDSAPRSRNEALAALMRRMRICEEQGTGIDKVVRNVELFQLPPPDFQVESNATRVILFSPRRFAAMSIDERVRACYQHAVLRYISGEKMRNATLRERFGIDAKNAAQVSQVIKLALERKLIRSADPERPQSAYVPFWA